MTSCLKERVQSLDFFGQGISLTIDRQATSQTILGGILGILLVLGLGSLGLYSLKDVIDHTNPVVTNEVETMSKSPMLPLDNGNFPLAFKIIDYYENAVSYPKYFSITVDFRWGNAREFMNSKSLQLRNCTRDEFQSDDENAFDNYRIDEATCFDNENVTLEGNWQEKYMTSLKVDLILCKNQTSSTITCASFEEIEQFLKNSTYYFEFFWVDFDFNARNYTTPTNYYINSMSKAIVFNETKVTRMYIHNRDLITDDGLLWGNRWVDSYLSIDKIMDDTYPFIGCLVDFKFYSSNTLSKTIRVYERIQSTIASIGGLINVGRIACMVICYMFSTIQRDEAILNKIFDYDFNNSNLQLSKTTNDLKKILENILESRRINNQRSSSPYMHVVPSNLSCGMAEQSIEKNKLDKVEVKPKTGSPKRRSLLWKGFPQACVDQKEMVSFINPDATKNSSQTICFVKKPEIELANKINELLQKKSIHHKLHFSFFQIIRTFICPFKCCLNEHLKEKRNLFRKSRDAIDEFIDITYIIHKMEEIERLKFILLNNDQLCLFNFMTKNLCTLNPEKERENQIEHFKNITKEKITRIAELMLAETRRSRYFGNNISDDINSRLNDLLIEELKNLF